MYETTVAYMLVSLSQLFLFLIFIQIMWVVLSVLSVEGNLQLQYCCSHIFRENSGLLSVMQINEFLIGKMKRQTEEEFLGCSVPYLFTINLNVRYF